MLVACKNEIPVFASFVRRLGRFLAEVRVEGRPEIVHVPNTGRMKELLVPGALVALRKAAAEATAPGGAVRAATARARGRKTRYDLWAVKFGGVWVCVDSRAANDVAAGLLEAILETGGRNASRGTSCGMPSGAASGDAAGDRVRQAPSPLVQGTAGLREALRPLAQGMTGLRREVFSGPHRFDLAVLKGEAEALVEVKSVNLVEDGVAKFPDAPTTRGADHLRYLSRRARGGEEAYVLFVVQRSDARLFRPHRGVDRAFAAALAEAAQSGVGVVAVRCEATPSAIRPVSALPVDIAGDAPPGSGEQEGGLAGEGVRKDDAHGFPGEGERP